MRAGGARVLWLAAAVLAGGAAAADEAVRHNDAGLRSLSRGRAADAVEAFGAARRLRPHSAVVARNLAAAFAALGEDHLEAGRSEEALRAFDRAVELHPRRLLYRLRRAEARLALGRDGDRLFAAEDLVWILERDPDHRRALVLLGGLDYEARRLSNAIGRWRRARELRPTDVRLGRRLESARRELAVEERYESLRNRNFLLRYSPKIPRAVAESCLAACSDAYARLVRQFDSVPDSVTVVTLYPRDEFRSATAHTWAAGLYDGTIRVAVAAGRRGAEAARRTVVHEFAHHLIHRVAPRTPRWLNEGLAQRAEGRSAAAAESLLRRRAPRVDELDARVYDGSSPSAVKRWYALSLAFTGYLHRLGGDRGIHDLLRSLGEGVGEQEALTTVYGTSRDELFRAWHAARLR
ncbi:MAG: peptidase MA family metallohydrolase [Planctomycetota bacterium]